MEVIDQDDVFFADLNKQISLLIMDDDPVDLLPFSSPATYQVFSGVVQPIRHPTQVQNYEQTKGTGVFIPRSTRRRRRKKQVRMNSTTSNITAQSENNSKGILPQRHLPSSNSYTSYNSFNHKRT